MWDLNQDQRLTDLLYCDFYRKVTVRLLNLNDPRSLRYLRLYFQLVRPSRSFGNELRDTGFDNPQIEELRSTLFYRAVHAFRSGPLMSSVVDFQFRNLFRKNRVLFDKILKKDVVRICSIGGRLPSDLVGAVSVLESAASPREVDFRVTVLETDGEWRNTCCAVLDCVECFGKDPWKTEFVTDLLQLKRGGGGESSRAKDALRRADVVTMVKFYSEFIDLPGDPSDLLKEIIDTMQPGALLFQLDFSKDDVIEFYDSVVPPSLDLVYEELCELHALDPDAVEKSHRLYRNDMPSPYYSKFMNVFARGWVKTTGRASPRKGSSIGRGELSLIGNPEKYNPRQTFLSVRALDAWEKKFAKLALETGLSRLGTKRRIETEKTERNLMLAKLMEERKKLVQMEKRIMLEEEDEEMLAKYVSEKRRYAAFKLKVYSYSLGLLQKSLEREERGETKRKRFVPVCL